MIAAKVIDPPDGKPGDWTEPRAFNLMFKTQVGPVADDESRSPTCVPKPRRACSSTSRTCWTRTNRKLPFGIAQIGKSFRNEITPRNFIFRVRELEQMEIEYFVQPGEDERVHDEWIEDHVDWWVERGRPEARKPETARASERKTVALLQAHGRHSVQLSRRSASTNWKASPTAPTGTSARIPGIRPIWARPKTRPRG